MVNLEKDLINSNETRFLVQTDPDFAQQLYAALCNIRWFKNGEEYTCSWRYAGGLVAGLEAEGKDYMDFYCSGNEGTVSEQVEKALGALGWTWEEYPKEEEE